MTLNVLPFTLPSLEPVKADIERVLAEQLAETPS